MTGVQFFPKHKERVGRQKPIRGYNRANPRPKEIIPEEDQE